MIETFLAFETATLLTFMGAAVILYLTPGADMMFTIASGIAGGPRAGAAAAAGISLGVACHVALAAVGLAAIVEASPAAYDAIRYAGVAYLLWLAWQMWHATPDTATGAGTVARAFRRGFVTNILNPKVALFVLAFLPQFTTPGAGDVWRQIVVLGAMLTVGGVLTDGAIGILAGVLGDRLRKGTRLLNRIAATMFAGLAARLAIV